MIFYSHYKKIRRERKISLEDISRRTKIDIKYLKYLESGKFSEIPGIYTKLFFKAYINEIGCDVDEALESLENFSSTKIKHVSWYYILKSCICNNFASKQTR